MIVKDIMSEDVVTVSVPGNREDTLEKIIKGGVSLLPVVKKGTNNLVGILARSDLITNPDEEQIAMLMSTDLVTVDINDSIEKAAEQMVKNNIRRIPVLDGEELVGIVTAFDMVSMAIAEMDIDDAVENYMITTVPVAWDQTPLSVAFEVMSLFGLKSVIGLNKEGDLTGILTETDFLSESEVISERTEHSSSVGTEGDKWSWDSTSILYIEKNKLKFSDKVIHEVSSKKVATANIKTKVSTCAERMKSLNIEQMPVLGIDGDLKGLIRASDLIKALL